MMVPNIDPGRPLGPPLARQAHSALSAMMIPTSVKLPTPCATIGASRLRDRSISQT